MVRRDSFSGERVGARFFLSAMAFLVAGTVRLRGSTAPVVGVARGARPFLGRVDASRCFLPSRLRSGRCAMGIPCSLFRGMVAEGLLSKSTGWRRKKYVRQGGRGTFNMRNTNSND